MVAHFDNDVLALAVVITIDGHYCMGGASGAAETVENDTIRFRGVEDEPRNKRGMLGSKKYPGATEQRRGLFFAVGIVLKDTLANICFNLVKHSFQTRDLLLVRSPCDPIVPVERYQTALVWRVSVILVREFPSALRMRARFFGCGAGCRNASSDD